MRILIVDDHAVIHQGLGRILSDQFRGATFGEAHNFQEGIELVKSKNWDVAILDMDLPGRSGLDLLKHIHALRPALPILVFSMYAEDQFAVRALKAGAMAYVSKNGRSEQLIEAIEKVCKGRRYISPELAEKFAADLGQPIDQKPTDLLSDREFEILRHIASGYSSTEIADLLSLSIKTVSTYRTRTLEKLHMKTNAELIRYAIEQKIGR